MSLPKVTHFVVTELKHAAMYVKTKCDVMDETKFTRNGNKTCFGYMEMVQ